MRSIKAQQKGASIYYALRRDGRSVMLKRSVIRDLAWGSPRRVKNTMRLKQLIAIRRDAVMEAATSERSDTHMLADDIVRGVKRLRPMTKISVDDALEVLAALGMRDNPEWQNLVKGLR